MTVPALPVVFTRRAARQVESAAIWWSENRPAAPDAIGQDLAAALRIVSRHPGVGAPAGSQRLRGVRRILLRRVSYLMYYRVAPRKKRLEILALWHARRGTRPRL